MDNQKTESPLMTYSGLDDGRLNCAAGHSRGQPEMPEPKLFPFAIGQDPSVLTARVKTPEAFSPRAFVQIGHDLYVIDYDSNRLMVIDIGELL